MSRWLTIVVLMLIVACDSISTPARGADLISISGPESDIYGDEVMITVANNSELNLNLLCAPEARIRNTGEWQEFEASIWPTSGKATRLVPVVPAQRSSLKWVPRAELRHSETRYRIRCDARQLVEGEQRTIQTAYSQTFRLLRRGKPTQD